MKKILLLLCFISTYALHAQVIFEDGFEDGTTFKPQWTSRPGTDGRVEIVKSTDVASGGQFGVVMGKNSDGDLTLNVLDLTLDLSGQNQVELSFDILSYSDETHEQDGLYFSDDGGQSFVKVYGFRPEDWCGNQYGKFPPFDIDALAAANGLNLTNQFVIRFQQYDDADFSTIGDEDGFYIDNVLVRVPPTLYAALPFTDDFEADHLDSAWSWSFADLTTLPNSTKPTGFVEITNTSASNGQRGLQIGKRCDDGFTTNAVDLHVNLEGQNQVELSFDILSYSDETHEQDGLYFSDDGGQSFVKVYGFRPEDWCGNQYGKFPPFDIDALAAANGLNLTNQFVIRFQQYDDADFSTIGDEDGFYIDNVLVRVPPTLYAALPFTDDFETGSLGDVWSWAFPSNTALPNTIKPTGSLGFNDYRSSEGVYGMYVGKRCDDGFTTNAVDLHVNLEGQNQVELSFDFLDYYNENHEQDGIYFSSDGGMTFTKIYDFDYQQLTDDRYTRLSINIEPSQLGISFSDSSIIRFQQYDDADFSTSGDEDGFYIDNVVVQNTALPFITSFSPGVAPVGREVTLTGINLHTVTGIQFNGASPITGQVVDSATLVVVVPEGATTGKISITNEEGTTTSENNFVVSSDNIAAPYNLQATAVGNSIQLIWADTTDNETGFEIERRKTSESNFTLVASLSKDVKSYSDINVMKDTTYEYKVRAINVLGNSPFSEVVSAMATGTSVTPEPPSAAPTNLAASAPQNADDTYIDLVWEDNADNEAGYRVLRRRGNEDFAEVAVLPANTTSYRDIGLAFGAEYTYMVVAYNNAGETESNEDSATTVDKVLGLDDLEEISEVLRIFPNPVRHQLQLQLKNELYGQVQIRILNLLGQEQQVIQLDKKQPVIKETLDLSNLNVGMYFVEVVQGQHRSLQRVAKQ